MNNFYFLLPVLIYGIIVPIYQAHLPWEGWKEVGKNILIFLLDIVFLIFWAAVFSGGTLAGFIGGFFAMIIGTWVLKVIINAFTENTDLPTNY